MDEPDPIGVGADPGVQREEEAAHSVAVRSTASGLGASSTSQRRIASSRIAAYARSPGGPNPISSQLDTTLRRSRVTTSTCG